MTPVSSPATRRSSARTSPLSGGTVRLERPEPKPQADEALLGPVMQVSFDPPPRFVGGGHDSGPRRGQFASGVRVRDRRPDELGEGGQPGPPRRRERCRRATRPTARPRVLPPTTTGPATADRSLAPDLLRDRSGGRSNGSVRAGGPCPPHTGRDVVAGQRQPTGTRVGGTVPSLPAGMEADGLVRLESSRAPPARPEGARSARATTALKMSSDGRPSATRVATRRRADCWSSSRRWAVWLSLERRRQAVE